MNIYEEKQTDIIHETSVDFVLRPCTKEIHIVQYDMFFQKMQLLILGLENWIELLYIQMF